MENRRNRRDDEQGKAAETPAEASKGCSPGGRPTPKNVDPNRLVSSGGSGNVHTPPSGEMDEASKAEGSQE